jgi:hypothetical protein
MRRIQSGGVVPPFFWGARRVVPALDGDEDSRLSCGGRFSIRCHPWVGGDEINVRLEVLGGAEVVERNGEEVAVRCGEFVDAGARQLEGRSMGNGALFFGGSGGGEGGGPRVAGERV